MTKINLKSIIMELIKEIQFTSNEYAESPTHVRLSFTPEDYDRIAMAMIDVKEKGYFSVNLWAHGELLFAEYRDWPYEDQDGDDIRGYTDADFRVGVEYFTCYSDNFYFRADHKHDCKWEVESCEITLDEILKLFAEQVNK